MTNDDLNAQGWIRCFSGGRFYPLSPKASDVRIEDIAHALSMMCRFTGHTQKFYSVAEHCVRASQIVPDHAKLWTLLHDAAEAYVCDIARPVKQLPAFDQYRAIEKHIERVILSNYGLPSFTQEPPTDVKVADNIMLATEARDLMGVRDPVKEWKLPYPLGERIHPWSPAVAERRYLHAFYRLYRPLEQAG